MDSRAIEYEVRNNLVKEGCVEKKSKFLKEWRERWLVLTVNYLFTFKTSQYKNPTEVLDLKIVQSLKSYFRKGPEEIGEGGFKICSDGAAYYFRCRSVGDKWGWVLELERTLHTKFSGPVPERAISGVLRRGGSLQQEMAAFERSESRLGKQTHPPQSSNISIQRHRSASPEKLRLLEERSTATTQYPKETQSTGVQTLSLVEIHEPRMPAVPEPPTAAYLAFKKDRKRRHFVDQLTNDVGLRRSRMMRSLFDELMCNPSSRHRSIFFEILKHLLAESEGEILKYLSLECRVHSAKEIFSVMLAPPHMAVINSEASAVELLLCLRNLSPYVEEVFNHQQLEVLQTFLIRCFETFGRKENVLTLLLQTVESLELCEQTSEDFHRQIRRQLSLLERTVRDEDLLRRIRDILGSLPQ